MKRFAQKGYSVVEVLLAGALFAIVAGGVVTAIVYAQRTNESAFAREKALRVAEEGIEAVRSIRQRDFELIVNSPAVGLDYTDNQWNLIYFPSENDDVTPDGFRRRLIIEDGPTNFTKNLTVTVDYRTGGERREVQLASVISDLSGEDAASGEGVDGLEDLVSNNFIIVNDGQSAGDLQDLVIQSVRNIGGVEFWYAADQKVSLSEGTGVSLWYDLSGNDHHVQQPGVEARPTLEEGIINGYPALLFDGLDDTLLFPDIDLSGLDGMTAFLVTASNSDQDANNFSGSFSPLYLGGGREFYINPQQSEIAFKFGASPDLGEIVYPRPSNIGTGFSLTAARKNQDTEELFVNGGVVGTYTGRNFPTDQISSPGSLSRLNIFGTRIGFDGYIAEIIVFNDALTDDELAAITTYLNEKYNIY